MPIIQVCTGLARKVWTPWSMTFSTCATSGPRAAAVEAAGALTCVALRSTRIGCLSGAPLSYGSSMSAMEPSLTAKAASDCFARVQTRHASKRVFDCCRRQCICEDIPSNASSGSRPRRQSWEAWHLRRACCGSSTRRSAPSERSSLCQRQVMRASHVRQARPVNRSSPVTAVFR